MQCGGWSIVYVKTKTGNTLAWFVCKLFARRGRDEGVQQKELCVQQREVNDVPVLLNDVPVLLQCKPVCSCKSTYIFFQYFFVMYIHPKKSCTSKGAGSHTKNNHLRTYIGTF